MLSEPSVAIIGAGMAGLSCGVTLAVEWPNVTIFEKNAAAGGRLASVQQDNFQFDMGAQYFTAEDDAFKARVADWLQDWSANEWKAWLVHLENGQALSHRDAVTRYVGVPAMDAILDSMADLCEVRCNTNIEKLQRDGDQWRLFSGDKDLGVFDHVIIAAPPKQAAKLMQADAMMLKQLNAVYLSPCWTVMLGFAQPQNLGFDGAFVVDSKIDWMARNNSKPERVGQESWILHAACEWSEQNHAMPPQQVITELCESMAQSAGVVLDRPVFSQAHFWPEAKAVQLAGAPYLYNSDLQLGACGDWCVAARVEGAFLSGLAMATVVLARHESR